MSLCAPQRLSDPYEDAGNDRLFEVVRGWRVDKLVGVFQCFIAMRIGLPLMNISEEKGLGRALIQASFKLAASGNDRKPDVAFVSYAKWAKTRPIPEVNAWDVVPDLAVEVISPTDKTFEVLEKLQEYFDSGVQQVWHIYSNLRTVFIFESQTSVRVLTETDELNGDPVVPGFRMPVAKLFPPTEPLVN